MKSVSFLYCLATTIVFGASGLNGQSLPQLGKSPIDKVIAAMTLEEKVAFVVGTGLKFGDDIDKNAPYKIPNQPIPGSLAAKSKVYVVGAIGRTLEIPRLGIPTMEMVDGPTGVSFGSRSTAYPIATALASTWDEALVTKIGQCMGNETREYGFDLLLAPAINIHRNPLGGRNFEYYSEDPLLSGKMGAAMVNGIQSQGVGTSLKHFAANNQETNRIEVDAIVSERALREIYLRSFEIAIRESNPWTLMAAYNSVNGHLATQNQDLLTAIARKEWGYTGVIVSDWEAGKDPVAQMKAGLNLILPGPYQDTVLLQAVKAGKLSENVLDQNISWILQGLLKTPKYRHYAYSKKPDFEANTQIARQAAAEGMVLLKNENQALPLINPQQSIALFGNGSYETLVGGSGSGFVMTAGPTVHLANGLANRNVRISDELKQVYQAYITENTPKQNRLDLARGRKIRAPELAIDNALIDRVANQTDHAIITLARISGETTDRLIDGNFDLTADEKKNIERITTAFHAKGKTVTVVLNIGGVVETASWKQQPDAILVAWQPGQEAGNAIADVLSGAVNPSGKLTVSWPIRYDDEPSAQNFPGTPVEKPKQVVYEEGIYVGYRYYNTFGVKTSYPFGYGLSYTNFKYDNLKLSSKTFTNGLDATLTITNTGKVYGQEVVQWYVSAPAKTIDKPVQELKGFAKTRLLKPGESQTITFRVDAEKLASFYADQSAWIAEAGQYFVKAGASCEDIRVSESFDLAKQIRVKTVTKALAPQVKINELTKK